MKYIVIWILGYWWPSAPKATSPMAYDEWLIGHPKNVRLIRIAKERHSKYFSNIDSAKTFLNKTILHQQDIKDNYVRIDTCWMETKTN